MPSADELRATLCELPGLERVTFTTGVRSSPSVATYTGIAANVADTRRVIVSSDLEDFDASEEAQEVANDYFDGSWVYLPTYAEVRRVARGGFTSGVEATDVTSITSSEGVGYFTTTRRFTTALPAGLRAEVYRRLAPIGNLMPGKTLLGCLNDALAATAILHRVSVTADGTRRISLTSLPWLSREDQLAQVLGTDGYRYAGSPRIRFDAQIPYLEFDYAITSGTALTVEVLRPRYTWINTKRTARATATVAAGAVTAFSVVDGGTGYTTAPTITVTGAGSGATGTATLSGTSIASIAVGAAGSGYGTAPTTVVIGAPTGTWADSTVGLVNGEDECTGPLKPLVLCAYFFACDYLALNDPRGELDVWKGRRDRVLDAVLPYLMFLQPESRPELQPSRYPTELWPGIPGGGWGANGVSDWP